MSGEPQDTHLYWIFVQYDISLKCEWISAKLTLYYLTYDKLLSFASEVVFWAILKDFEFAVYCTFKREKWELLIESARCYHFPHPCQPNMAQHE